MNRDELKSKIKQVMLDHLTPLGYPHMSTEEILKELKPMYIKLEESGLTVPGMSYAEYVRHAEEQKLFADLGGGLGEQINQAGRLWRSWANQ